MKPTISSHSDNDRWTLYEFTRDSKLPHGTFDRGIHADAVVAVACVVIAVLMLFFVWFTEGGL